MGGKSEAPPPPDYRGAAEATGQSNLANINAQTKANRPDVYSPFGSSTWQNKGGNWTNTINLDPAAQAALDDQQSITAGRSDIAQGMLGSAGREMQTPDDFFQTLPGVGQVPGQGGALPGRGEIAQGQDIQQQDIQQNLDFSGAGDVNAGGGYNPDFAQTQFDRQMSLMGPQQERAMQQMDTRLRNQGLAPGSQAYDNAMGDLRNQQGEVTSRMSQDAMRLGADEQQRQFGREMGVRQQGVSEVGQQGMFGNAAAGQQFGQDMASGSQRFGQDMASAQMADQQRGQAQGEQAQDFGQGTQQFNMQNQQRQQAIAEQLQKEGWSLNKINAMLSGQQVGMPNMPDFKNAGVAAGTDYSGAANAAGSYGLKAHEMNAAAQAAPWEMLGQVGGGLASAAKFSDERLKTDVHKIGEIGGLDRVTWLWNGKLDLEGPSIGFIAQQVQELYPQHVHERSGYLTIDYDSLDRELEAA